MLSNMEHTQPISMLQWTSQAIFRSAAEPGRQTLMGEFVKKMLSAILLCVLVGCASAPPQSGYSICSTQPGTYACQIEQYQNVGF